MDPVSLVVRSIFLWFASEPPQQLVECLARDRPAGRRIPGLVGCQPGEEMLGGGQIGASEPNLTALAGARLIRRTPPAWARRWI